MQTVQSKSSLRQRVLTGAMWSALARVGAHVFTVLSVIFVARVLAPRDYGLMNMAFIMTTLIALLRDLGAASAVVQKRSLTDQLLSSVFWLNLGLGVAASLFCVAIAPLAAWFYREPAVIPVMRLFCVTFAVTGLTATHTALLNREMRFGALAAAELAGGAAGLVTAITLAHTGHGVWSLVWAALANSGATGAVTLAVRRWRPVLHYSWADIRQIWSFGMNLAGFNAANFLARNADKALIGRYLGSAPVGVYQFAYTLMLFPVQNLTFMVCRVLFPAFSELQDDPARLRQAYVRVSGVVAMATFPLMAGAALLAGPLIYVLLGDKWRDVAPLVMILAPVGMIQSLGSLVGQIYTATARVDLLLRWGLFSSTITVLSFVAGLPWGVQGVALSYAAAMALLTIPMFTVPFRLIDLRLTDFGRMLLPYASATAGMALVVVILRRALEAGAATELLVLVVCTALGAGVYGGLLWFLRPHGLVELVGLLSRIARSASSDTCRPAGSRMC